MHPLFAHDRLLNPIEIQLLKKMLIAGPWCWPNEDVSEMLSVARRVSGILGPRPLEPGVVPLVSVDPTGPSLWALDLDKCERLSLTENTEGHFAQMGLDVLDRWNRTARMLPSWLPVLWRCTKAETLPIPYARHIVSMPAPKQTAVRVNVLKGKSFDLAFALAMASRVTEVPLPGDFAASAVVDEHGRTWSVDGVEEKVGVVGSFAPRVKRFLVAKDQGPEARRAVENFDMEIVPVDSVGQAIKLLLPDLEVNLLRKVVDPKSRREIVESLFYLALGDRQVVNDWNPVERAAAVLLEEHESNGKQHSFRKGSLGERRFDFTEGSSKSTGRVVDDIRSIEEVRLRLEFVRAVAARHEGKVYASELFVPLPAPQEIFKLAQPWRIFYLAHLTQHAADIGKPDPERVLALIDRHVVEGNGAFQAHLKLLGAKGRLAAVMGLPEEALRCQIEAASGWIQRRDSSGISLCLCECFRLSGVLGLDDVCCETDQRFEQASGLGKFSTIDHHFLNLARAQAYTLLGRSDEAERLLARIVYSATFPRFLKFSALRWIVRLHRESKKTEVREVAENAYVCLEQQAQQDQQAKVFWALARLERCRDDLNEAKSALNLLLQIEPQPAKTLLKFRKTSGSPEMEDHEYIRHFYPY
jgi:hypothetical protein